MPILRKIFSFSSLTLLVALTLSAIAAWYSVLGLTAIFAAAVLPIIIMGGALEVAKVVTTVWLHKYWDKAKWTMKLYLVPAVVALAMLTSMGIFGFLSKAHIEQGVPTGDVAAQVSLIDEKIAVERANIENSRTLVKQMDEVVNRVTADPNQETKNRDGTVTVRSSAERALQIRRGQANDRARLTKEIDDAQKRIMALQEEKAPLASKLRQVEAEVGPIKYIAAMIYGDNPDQNTLERAVRWMIILIVLVFDPLALMLVLAATSSYKWEEEKWRAKQEDNADPLPPPPTEEKPEEPQEPENPVDTEPEVKSEEPVIEEEKAEVVQPELEERQDEDAEILQPDDAKLDVMVGETVHENTVAQPDENGDGLEQVQEEVERQPVRTIDKEIKTEGVTLAETDGGYIQYDGKSMQKDALKSLHPEMFMLTADSTEQVSTNFGTAFPKVAKKGDIFVRVDVLPNRVYKFDSFKWIEINKAQTDSYLYDEQYIRYLVQKLENGEYDIDLLNDNEKAQIEEYLKNQNT